MMLAFKPSFVFSNDHQLSCCISGYKCRDRFMIFILDDDIYKNTAWHSMLRNRIHVILMTDSLSPDRLRDILPVYYDTNKYLHILVNSYQDVGTWKSFGYKNVFTVKEDYKKTKIKVLVREIYKCEGDDVPLDESDDIEVEKEYDSLESVQQAINSIKLHEKEVATIEAMQTFETMKVRCREKVINRALRALGLDDMGIDRHFIIGHDIDDDTICKLERCMLGREKTPCFGGLKSNLVVHPLLDQIDWLIEWRASGQWFGSSILLDHDLFDPSYRVKERVKEDGICNVIRHPCGLGVATYSNRIGHYLRECEIMGPCENHSCEFFLTWNLEPILASSNKPIMLTKQIIATSEEICSMLQSPKLLPLMKNAVTNWVDNAIQNAEDIDKFERSMFGKTNTPCRSGLEQNLFNPSVPLDSQIMWLIKWMCSHEWMGSHILMHPYLYGKHILKVPKYQEKEKRLIIAIDHDSKNGIALTEQPNSLVFYPHFALKSPFLPNRNLKFELVHLDNNSLCLLRKCPNSLFYGFKSDVTGVLLDNIVRTIQTNGKGIDQTAAESTEHLIPQPCNKRLVFAYDHDELRAWNHRAGWHKTMSVLSRMSAPPTDVDAPELLVVDIIEKTFSWDIVGKKHDMNAIKHIHYEGQDYKIPMRNVRYGTNTQHVAMINSKLFVQWTGSCWCKYEQCDNVSEFMKLPQLSSKSIITRDYIGFWHNPPNVPEWFDFEHSPQMILDRDHFRSSLKYCRGIITMSEYLAEWLQERLPSDIPVWSVPHPTDIPEKLWDPNGFLENKDKYVIQLGWWLRCPSFIYNIKVNCNVFKKMWLFGNVRAFEMLQKECIIQKTNDDIDLTRVVVASLENWEYDDVLSKNVVATKMYDSSVNNAIIECIVRNTPILVNRLRPAEEYLGKEYPFFFDDDEEANQKINDIALILKTHQYLKENRHMLIRNLTYATFNKNIKSILDDIVI